MNLIGDEVPNLNQQQEYEWNGHEVASAMSVGLMLRMAKQRNE
jgi:hypothetical protein